MKTTILAAAALAATCAFAQGGSAQPRGGAPHMNQAGPWVARMLSSKTTLEKIGVTDEAMREAILAGIVPLREKGDAIEKKIRDISREQAELTRGLFEDKQSDPKPVMDKISEVAKLRAEQGRISVKAIIVLRDNLSPEQLEKAKSVILERGRERWRMRRGEGEGEGSKRGVRGDGDAPKRGRKHAAEGDGDGQKRGRKQAMEGEDEDAGGEKRGRKGRKAKRQNVE